MAGGELMPSYPAPRPLCRLLPPSTGRATSHPTRERLPRATRLAQLPRSGYAAALGVVSSPVACVCLLTRWACNLSCALQRPHHKPEEYADFMSPSLNTAMRHDEGMDDSRRRYRFLVVKKALKDFKRELYALKDVCFAHAPASCFGCRV